MAAWGHVPGETPIDPSGLKLRGSITTRRELAAAEAINISKPVLKYLAAKPHARSARFDFAWLLEVHEEMFCEVWEWAGRIRTHELNLGVPACQVAADLAALVNDLHSWTGFGHAFDLQAVWLHHRAVRIHPFANGNGRWARLLANIWLKLHSAPLVIWPDEVLGTASTIRGAYLAAIRNADNGDYVALTKLHQQFTERPDQRMQ